MSRATMDMNRVWVSVEEDWGYDKPVDNSTPFSGGEVRAIFRNLDHELVELIGQSQVVVGCVAWLTHRGILRALAKVPGGVSIVVQKEDFLRPDSNSSAWHDVELRDRYAAITGFDHRASLGGVATALCPCTDPLVQAVRCVGNHNADKRPAFPRMHNKFMVFCDKEHYLEDGEYESDRLVPKAVWTGSFNMTWNATASLENAVVITSPQIASAYLDEWRQILAISEPLNWASKWCAPEWRIGT